MIESLIAISILVLAVVRPQWVFPLLIPVGIILLVLILLVVLAGSIML